MKVGTLLNQNIKVEKEIEGYNTTIRFTNTSNGMELANIWIDRADECEVWINPGGFITKEEYDKAIARKELKEINSEIISNE